jgi:HAD superfamily hydrolase (TIGR01490 family)
MPEGKTVIAAFDLDGTLTRRDTLIDFLIAAVGYRKLALGLLAKGPVLLGHFLGMVSGGAAKQALLAHFFKGWQVAEFDKRCRAYSSSRLPGLLKDEALSRCDWHRQQGHRLVCVTASIRNWVAPWALDYGFASVIATEMETQGEVLTGRFEGGNCNGPEKARRFLEIFPDRERYTLFAYGDSRGDRELLALADHRFFRHYR